MSDLTKLIQLRNLHASNAQEVPICAICGLNPAPDVCHGKLPDGSEAGFIPTCQGCWDQLKAPPPAQAKAPGGKT